MGFERRRKHEVEISFGQVAIGWMEEILKIV